MQSRIFPVRVLCITVLSAAISFHAAAADTTHAPALRENPTGGSYQYHVPEKANDGWETGNLSSANLNAGLINECFERINAHFYTNLHSVLLVRSNRLVVEEYFPGPDWDGKHQAFNRDTLHSLQSATKSVNSLLIGIAIDQHLIRGVDEKISAFFPEFTGKDDIRLRHFLSMTAGLDWNESEILYTDPRNDAARMNQTNDPVRFVLERPVVAAPGKRFVYNSGISVTLGEIIRKVSGLSADKFAERNLFKPLGITNYSWWAFPNGVVHTGGGLALRPRDMAKIGYLFLNDGRWQGKQIVSEEWIRESVKEQAPDPGPDGGYGYQWWRFSFKVGDQWMMTFQARGHGGQSIFVIPRLHMVAVFTAWNTDQIGPFLRLMGQNILPAAGSD